MSVVNEEALDELYETLIKVYQFLYSEYRDERCIALEGELIAKEARDIWNDVCDKLSKFDGDNSYYFSDLGLELMGLNIAKVKGTDLWITFDEVGSPRGVFDNYFSAYNDIIRLTRELDGLNFGEEKHSLSFDELRKSNVDRQKEWPGNEEADIPFRALEVAGEFGEVAESVKKYLRGVRGIKGSTATKEDIKEEIGDAIISLDLLAKELDIDLGDAVKEKFNLTSEKYDMKTRM